jgi:nucleotide-binding universal stress UspA family protein
MGHFQTILVPVDGSPPSLAGLCQAAVLAEDLDAKLEILHVAGADTFEVGSTTSAAKPAREAAERDMADAIATVEATLHERVRSRTVAGDPVQKILEVASDLKPDLIVLGTHGRVGRLHSLVGSVAQAIVRNAPCPVLTVREPDGEEESFAERIHHRASVLEQSRSPR